MTEEMRVIYARWKKRVVEVVKSSPQRSYQNIGKDFNVSGAYVAQIAKSAGISRPLGAKPTKKEG